MKLKLKISIKILATIENCLTLVIIQLNQNISNFNDNSNKLMAGKMEDKTNGVAIEEVVR